MKDLIRLSENELIDRAIRAHLRRTEHYGLVAAQPCYVRSKVRRDRVIPANVRGALAEYRLGKRCLVRLRDE